MMDSQTVLQEAETVLQEAENSLQETRAKLRKTKKLEEKGGQTIAGRRKDRETSDEQQREDKAVG